MGRGTLARTEVGAEGPGELVEAIVYGRASQGRHLLMRSVDDQVNECEAWCRPLGWHVVRVIKDANRSASQWRRREREGFEEALSLIESGRYRRLVT